MAPSNAHARGPALVAAQGHRCPRCGSGFECGATRHGEQACACASVMLTEQQRESLKQKYAGCLCLACLRALAAAPELALEPGPQLRG